MGKVLAVEYYRRYLDTCQKNDVI